MTGPGRPGAEWDHDARPAGRRGRAGHRGAGPVRPRPDPAGGGGRPAGDGDAAPAPAPRRSAPLLATGRAAASRGGGPGRGRPARHRPDGLDRAGSAPWSSGPSSPPSSVALVWPAVTAAALVAGPALVVRTRRGRAGSPAGAGPARRPRGGGPLAAFGRVAAPGGRGGRRGAPAPAGCWPPSCPERRGGGAGRQPRHRPRGRRRPPALSRGPPGRRRPLPGRGDRRSPGSGGRRRGRHRPGAALGGRRAAGAFVPGPHLGPGHRAGARGLRRASPPPPTPARRSSSSTRRRG